MKNRLYKWSANASSISPTWTYWAKIGRRKINASNFDSGIASKAGNAIAKYLEAQEMSQLIPEGQIVTFDIQHIETSLLKLVEQAAATKEVLRHVPAVDRKVTIEKFASGFDQCYRAAADYCEYIARLRIDGVSIDFAAVTDIQQNISGALRGYKELTTGVDETVERRIEEEKQFEKEHSERMIEINKHAGLCLVRLHKDLTASCDCDREAVAY